MAAMPVVSVKNVTKDYKIYSQRGQKFKEWLTLNRRQYHDVKRALENVSFDVEKGECFGIIGDNGCGKSSILKILAGTSYATEGTAEVNGEVSYILDVATGFNFEFTGRENIYTKCALLGLTPIEIEERYNSIVEFSGLEERIDHPLKTYSTGMIMRIGFSVAVHIPFEILIVDEILSVGDYLFQRKCVNAIRSIIESGKTVIITSHALSDVSAFCNRLMLLSAGQVMLIDETEKVIQAYVEDCECRFTKIEAPIVEDRVLSTCIERVGSLTLEEVKFYNGRGRETLSLTTGESLRISMRFFVSEPVTNPCIRVQFFCNDGLLATGSNTFRHDMDLGTMQGSYEVHFDIGRVPLLEGDYYVNVGLWPDEWKSYTAKTPYDVHEYRHVLKIRSNREHGGGLVWTDGKWTLSKLRENE